MIDCGGVRATDITDAMFVGDKYTPYTHFNVCIRCVLFLIITRLNFDNNYVIIYVEEVWFVAQVLAVCT